MMDLTRHEAQLERFYTIPAPMLFNLTRLHRAISSFNHVTHRWAATPLDGVTWDVGVKLEDRMKSGRLGKALMLGLEPDEIEVLQPGLVGADRP